MTDTETSTWAYERFGGAAPLMRDAAFRAMHDAHALALSAHLASELSTNDAYGSTLMVTQHQQLVRHTCSVPGVAARKPKSIRSRFRYPVLDETAVVLFPWRYATDGATSHTDARMRLPVSELRQALMSLPGKQGDAQLTLDEGDLDREEFEARRQEERDLREQLPRFGRVVTIGFASNPTLGLAGLGWGDAELLDPADGTVKWHEWEPLRPSPAIDTDERAAHRVISPPLDEQVDRFDRPPLTD